MGRLVAGSPTLSRYSRWPCAWPVSPSAVERKSAEIVVMAFDVGFRGEIQVAAVRLRLAGERGLEVVVGLGAFERFHGGLL
jgi:hypothetical protein